MLRRVRSIGKMSCRSRIIGPQLRNRGRGRDLEAFRIQIWSRVERFYTTLPHLCRGMVRPPKITKHIPSRAGTVLGAAAHVTHRLEAAHHSLDTTSTETITRQQTSNWRTVAAPTANGLTKPQTAPTAQLYLEKPYLHMARVSVLETPEASWISTSSSTQGIPPILTTGTAQAPATCPPEAARPWLSVSLWTSRMPGTN